MPYEKPYPWVRGVLVDAKRKGSIKKAKRTDMRYNKNLLSILSLTRQAIRFKFHCTESFGCFLRALCFVSIYIYHLSCHFIMLS